MPETAMLYAGVDGGATRTRAALSDASGRIVGYGTAGPSNYDNVGVATASANIRDAIVDARRAAGRETEPLASLFLGMAGVVSDADRETVVQMVLEQGLAPRSSISVDHDIRIALAGGLEGREGIVLIAGTGSSTYGRRSNGQHHRTGWGYLLDDRGSGYALGLGAMVATVMAADGRGAPTHLSEIVHSRLGLQEVDEIMRTVYHNGVSVTEIAALAPEVIRCAVEGDAVALELLSSGASELARMVETVARRLAFTGQAFPLTMVGGLVDHAGPYRDMVSHAIRSTLPEAMIEQPALPPVVGALLLSLLGAGIPSTEALRANLHAGSRTLAPANSSSTRA